jgi:hypothetical protein
MSADTRDERRRSRAEWRRMWRAVPREQQRRVSEALQRGEAVDDTALAPIAVDAAEHRLRGDDSAGSPRLLLAIGVLQAFIAIALTVSAAAGGHLVGIAIGCAMLALVVAQLVTQWSVRRRLARAAEANRALTAQARYPHGTT